MHGVRGISYLIFFLVLISGFILPMVCADQTLNITDQMATPGLMNETFNPPENSTLTGTLILLASEPTITETIPPDETPFAANETTIPAPTETLTITTATTELTLDPTVTETVEPQEPLLPAANGTITTAHTEKTCSESPSGIGGMCSSSPSRYPLMHPSKARLDDEEVHFKTLKKYALVKLRDFTAESIVVSKTLLSYISYVPSERYQGYCGDCWVWAATGALEIDQSVKTGIKERLSTQYFNSKYNSGSGADWACCGGSFETFTTWYNNDKIPIPWSNANAGFGDGGRSCEDYATAVPIGSISTNPHYQLNSISSSTISTDGVGQSTAIANIKSAIDNNKGVFYNSHYGTSGWDAYKDFWGTQAESAIFNPDSYGGQEDAGGHAVLIVGYDTSDAANPYWIVLNSWGTTAGRPNGSFRLKMKMNYDNTFISDSTSYVQHKFYVLDAEFQQESVDAQMVSNTIPSTMAAGQSQSASITVKNTGTTAWTSGTGFGLGTVGNGDANTFLGTNRVYIPSGTTVVPGGSHTFTFTMTSPSTAGTYNPQFRMLQENVRWFGDTLSTSVQVTTSSYNAQMVSNTIPSTMAAGQSQSASITVKNTGTTAWTSGTGFGLGTVGNGDANTFLGTNRVYIPSGTTVVPGGSHTFTFTMTSPSTAGTYNPQFRMLQENVRWFGDTLSTSVQVTTSSYNAQMVSNTIPSTMAAGQSQSASITVKNTGTTAWTSGTGFGLGTVGNGDANTFLGTNRVYIPSGTTVVPGGSHTFTFTMTSPSTAGTYNPQFRMLQENVRWFGDTLSTSVQVTTSSYNAQMVSNTIPRTMAAGQSQSASITVKNTGTTAWTSGTGFGLGTVGNGDANTFLGTNRVYIPSGTTVVPGGSHTFTFTMTSPSTAGTYNPQFRMLQENVRWFGDTLSTSVQVTTSSYNAQMVSNTIPRTMAAGQSQSASITVKNTGTTAWTSGTGFGLGTVGNGDANTFLGTNRVYIPSGTTVVPGGSHTFTFTMTSPSTAGTYNPQFRMLQENVRWFGDTLSTSVQVTTSSYNAQMVSNTIPSTMAAGQSQSASITVKNTGTTAWTSGTGFGLGTVGNGDANTFLGTNRVYIPSGTTVVPGGSHTFTFTMTSPSTAGTYNPQFRMLQENVRWFGDTLITSLEVF